MLRVAIVLNIAVTLAVEAAWRLPHGATVSPELSQLNIGLIVPHTNFGVREYTRAIHTAVTGLHKSRGPKFNFLKNFTFTPHNVHSVLMELTPTPTDPTGLL
ncbi:NMDA receptor 2 [Carabus blaptoides fortunei]